MSAKMVLRKARQARESVNQARSDLIASEDKWSPSTSSQILANFQMAGFKIRWLYSWETLGIAGDIGGLQL